MKAELIISTMSNNFYWLTIVLNDTLYNLYTHFDINFSSGQTLPTPNVFINTKKKSHSCYTTRSNKQTSLSCTGPRPSQNLYRPIYCTHTRSVITRRPAFIIPQPLSLSLATSHHRRQKPRETFESAGPIHSRMHDSWRALSKRADIHGDKDRQARSSIAFHGLER